MVARGKSEHFFLLNLKRPSDEGGGCELKKLAETEPPVFSVMFRLRCLAVGHADSSGVAVDPLRPGSRGRAQIRPRPVSYHTRGAQQTAAEVITSKKATNRALHEGATVLTVNECIPDASSLTRVVPLRIASISRPEEALDLPWIERLPGEKRIKRIHGQTFVMQHYVGCRLIRAHISHTNGLPGLRNEVPQLESR
jgi:hypothetical protein